MVYSLIRSRVEEDAPSLDLAVDVEFKLSDVPAPSTPPCETDDDDVVGAAVAIGGEGVREHEVRVLKQPMSQMDASYLVACLVTAICLLACLTTVNLS